MVNVIVWLIAGAVLGWLATLIMRRRRSILLLNMVVGSVGAVVGGYLLAPILYIDTTSFSLLALLASMGGAVILLAIVNFFVREHTVKNTAIEGHWNQAHHKIHTRWEKITEEEIDQINGNHDQFIKLLQERYGLNRKEAEDQFQRFLQTVVVT